MERPKFAVRIDNVPDDPDPAQSRNLEAVLEKHKAQATLAIYSGWMKDWTGHQPIYKKLFDEGLADIACHGVYHEDFAGIGQVGGYGGKSHYFRPLTLPDADTVLKECQNFARTFFGRECAAFVTPGPANPTGYQLPREIQTFYEILKLNGFRAISHYVPCGVDPIVRVFKRWGLWEIPFTVYVDFWRRGWFRNEYTSAYYPIYVDSVKEHVKTRFRHGLYVCLMTHILNFRESPEPESGFAGGNPGGKFFDEIFTWVKETYPDVEFVAMDALLPKE